MLRIEEIEIEGYRSIRQAKIQLRGLNVLIGANGAGKSNLLGALGLLGDIANGQLQLSVARRGGAHTFLHFGRKKTSQLKLRVALQNAENGSPALYGATLESTSDDSFIFVEESTREGVSLGRDSLKGHRESVLAADLPELPDAFPFPQGIHSWRVFISTTPDLPPLSRPSIQSTTIGSFAPMEKTWPRCSMDSSSARRSATARSWSLFRR